MCLIIYILCTRCYYGYPRLIERCSATHPPLERCPRSTQLKFYVAAETECYLHPHHVPPNPPKHDPIPVAGPGGVPPVAPVMEMLAQIPYVEGGEAEPYHSTLPMLPEEMSAEARELLDRLEAQKRQAEEVRCQHKQCECQKGEGVQCSHKEFGHRHQQDPETSSQSAAQGGPWSDASHMLGARLGGASNQNMWPDSWSGQAATYYQPTTQFYGQHPESVGPNMMNPIYQAPFYNQTQYYYPQGNKQFPQGQRKYQGHQGTTGYIHQSQVANFPLPPTGHAGNPGDASRYQPFEWRDAYRNPFNPRAQPFEYPKNKSHRRQESVANLKRTNELAYGLNNSYDSAKGESGQKVEGKAAEGKETKGDRDNDKDSKTKRSDLRVETEIWNHVRGRPRSWSDTCLRRASIMRKKELKKDSQPIERKIPKLDIKEKGKGKEIVHRPATASGVVEDEPRSPGPMSKSDHIADAEATQRVDNIIYKGKGKEVIRPQAIGSDDVKEETSCGDEEKVSPDGGEERGRMLWSDEVEEELEEGENFLKVPSMALGGVPKQPGRFAGEDKETGARYFPGSDIDLVPKTSSDGNHDQEPSSSSTNGQFNVQNAIERKYSILRNIDADNVKLDTSIAISSLDTEEQSDDPGLPAPPPNSPILTEERPVQRITLERISEVLARIQTGIQSRRRTKSLGSLDQNTSKLQYPPRQSGNPKTPYSTMQQQATTQLPDNLEVSKAEIALMDSQLKQSGVAGTSAHQDSRLAPGFNTGAYPALDGGRPRSEGVPTRAPSSSAQNRMPLTPTTMPLTLPMQLTQAPIPSTPVESSTAVMPSTQIEPSTSAKQSTAEEASEPSNSDEPPTLAKESKPDKPAVDQWPALMPPTLVQPPMRTKSLIPASTRSASSMSGPTPVWGSVSKASTRTAAAQIQPAQPTDVSNNLSKQQQVPAKSWASLFHTKPKPKQPKQPKKPTKSEEHKKPQEPKQSEKTKKSEEADISKEFTKPEKSKEPKDLEDPKEPKYTRKAEEPKEAGDPKDSEKPESHEYVSKTDGLSKMGEPKNMRPPPNTPVVPDQMSIATFTLSELGAAWQAHFSNPKIPGSEITSPMSISTQTMRGVDSASVISGYSMEISDLSRSFSEGDGAEQILHGAPLISPAAALESGPSMVSNPVSQAVPAAQPNPAIEGTATVDTARSIEPASVVLRDSDPVELIQAAANLPQHVGQPGNVDAAHTPVSDRVAQQTDNAQATATPAPEVRARPTTPQPLLWSQVLTRPRDIGPSLSTRPENINVQADGPKDEKAWPSLDASKAAPRRRR